MNFFSKTLFVSLAIFGATTAANAESLIVNGGFEASTSSTVTPTGWTNVGHSEGVVTYAAFNTPVYEGKNFYDLGGYGNASGPIGDGIKQSFTTVAGTHYTVTFGLSSENSSGSETLTVSVGDTSANYVLGVDSNGVLRKPFATQTLDFVALEASSTLSFIHTAGAGGSNDPMIDGVSIASAETNVAAVPEPATYAMLLAGLGVLGFVASRRKSS